MTKLRVAIIGLGMAAGHHARSLIDLADRVDVVGVYSPTETRREAFAAQYGFPPVPDLDAVFDTRFADAVLILTPPNTHLELVERATKAGQHILLEKPLDISPERAKAAVSLARNAGVLLGVVLQNRFRSSFMTLQSMLQAGELGAILEASMSLRNWRPQQYYDAPGRGTLARDGGGVLLTQGIHTIDLLLALAGTPSNIAAFSRTTSIHRMETEDLVNAVFSFESGATGTLNATTCAYPGYPERIELICARGTALLTGDSLQANLHDGRMVSAGANIAAGFGSDPMAFGHDLHRELLGNFIDAIAKGNSLVVNGDDALRAHAFIDEILRSKR